MPDTPNTARQVSDPKYGDIWRASCPYCLWTTSGRMTLPCRTEGQALHVLSLHLVLCKGAR